MPLLHLTIKFCILLPTYQFFNKIKKVCCCIVSLIWGAINQLTYLANLTHLDLFSTVARFHSFFKCPSKFVVLTTKANTSSKSYLSQFNTNSFMLGINTLCSCTMSGNKNHFKDVRENPPSKDIGRKDGAMLSIQRIGTFIFCIPNSYGKTCTIQMPNSLYVPNLLLPLVSPQQWGQAIGDR